MIVINNEVSRVNAEIQNLKTREELIHRFQILLNTINSSKNIDVGKFHTYCMDTAKLYVKLYGWYYMPITAHKVLIHGSKMVSEAILPLGMFAIFIFESISFLIMFNINFFLLQECYLKKCKKQ